MIYTYTFTDISKRNDFINILTELGYNIGMNTYSKVISSKSDVQGHIIGNGANVKTTNNTITYYELNVEKNINQDEEYKLNKLFSLYTYNKLDISLSSMFIGGILLGILLTFIIGFCIDILAQIINLKFHFSNLVGHLILWPSIFFGIMYIGLRQSKNIDKDLDDFNKLKEYLLNNFVGNNGKNILNKL